MIFKVREFEQLGQIEENINICRRRIGQACAELEDIRDILVEAVRDKMSPRQLQVLEAETDAGDPSVQFFGVEWEGVFAKCFSLGLNIRIFKQRLTGDVVDRLGLAAILMDLRRVESELGDHLVAMLSGRLSRSSLAADLQERLCLGEKTTGVSGGSNTDLRGKKAQSASQGQVKYRKNKTENLASKIGATEHLARKNQRTLTVVEPEGIRKKKKSFVERVSNLFVDNR